MWFQLAFSVAFVFNAFIRKEDGTVFLIGAAICHGISEILIELKKHRGDK